MSKNLSGKTQTVATMGFKGIGFVSIVASEELSTDAALSMASKIIAMTRNELEDAEKSRKAETKTD